MEDFFTVLKRKRKEKYTQAEFAKALGVSDTTVQTYESKEIPGHDRVRQINILLQYDFSRHIYQEIFGHEDAPQSEVKALLSDLKGLITKYEQINSGVDLEPDAETAAKLRSLDESLEAGEI